LASSSVFTSSTLIPGTGVSCLNNGESPSVGNPLSAKWTLVSGILKWNSGSIESVVACKDGSGVPVSNPLDDPDWCFKGIPGANGDTYAKFRIAYPDKPYCADVLVRKQWDSAGLVSTTTVTSRGYNTCDTSNPRRIQRALEFSY